MANTALYIIAALVFLSFACVCCADNRMSMTQLTSVPGASVQATKPTGNMVASVHGKVYYTGFATGTTPDVLSFPKAGGGTFTLTSPNTGPWSWVGMMDEAATGFTWVYRINSNTASGPKAYAYGLCAFSEGSNYGVYVVGTVKGSPAFFFNRNYTMGTGTTGTLVSYVLRVLESGTSQLIMQAYSTGTAYGNSFDTCLSVPGTSNVLVGGYFVRAISFNGTSLDTGASTAYNTPIVIYASSAGKAIWNKYWSTAGGPVEALATDSTNSYFYAAGYYTKNPMSTLTDCTSLTGNCAFLFQLSAANGAETSVLGGCYTSGTAAVEFYGLAYYNNVLYVSGQSAGTVTCSGTTFSGYTQFLMSTSTSAISFSKILSGPGDSGASSGLLSSVVVDTTNYLLYYAFSFASTFDGCGTTFNRDGSPLDTSVNFAVAMYDVSSTAISTATSCKSTVVQGTALSAAHDISPSLALSSATAAGVDTLFLTTFSDNTIGAKFWKLTGYLCGNNGTSMSDGTCVCAYGYGGSRCGTKCPTKNGNICNNQGYCNSVSTATPACTCNFGYNGTACDVTICNGRGAKQGSSCLCAAGWTGTACDVACSGYMI